MCDDLVDVGDDFWNHPSLLQYASISTNNTNSNNNNNRNPSTIGSNASSSIQNPRKRKFNAIDLTIDTQQNDNINSNKRPRIISNTNYSASAQNNISSQHKSPNNQIFENKTSNPSNFSNNHPNNAYYNNSNNGYPLNPRTASFSHYTSNDSNSSNSSNKHPSFKQNHANSTSNHSNTNRFIQYTQNTQNAMNSTSNHHNQTNSIHSNTQNNTNSARYTPNHSNHSNSTQNGVDLVNNSNLSHYFHASSASNAPECNHKLPMTQRITRKQNSNHGRAFWCCAQSKQNQCKSFIWDDQWQRNWKKKKRKMNGNNTVNAYQLMMNKKFLVSTELICIDPYPLVEVSLNPPEPRFVEEIKKCDQASWNRDKRKWILPLDEHSKLISNQRTACNEEGYIFRMDVIPQEIIKNVNKWKLNEKRIKSDMIIKKENDNNNNDEYDEYLQALPLKLRSSMYEFQKEGFKFAIKKEGRCLIADEMGLGKSIQAIAIAYHYRSNWPLLIIVPSSLTLTWKMEILKWLKGLIYDYDINIIKKGSDKMLNYDDNININKPLCPITIISYGLAVRKQAEICDNDKLFGMIICDESHALKNYKTQRCKILLPLIKRNIKRVILLSGTPTNNRPSELWTQIDSLRSNEFMSYKNYTTRYCEGQNSKFGWIANGAMHLKELHAIIKYRVMIRRCKKDVLTQLPDKIRTVISIECDKTLEKKIQKKMQKDLDFQEEISQIQITDIDDDEYNENDNNNDDKHDIFDKKHKNMLELYSLTGKSKIGKIKEYIFDLFESGEKFLIFGHHQDVLDGIQECVDKKCKTSFIRIDGKTNSDKRQILVDKFQNNDNIRIAILSITAAGLGLTLTAATSVVFAELYWSPTSLLQCEDRAHRISQKSIVNIIYLLGRGSLDDKMWPMISKKMQIISKTLSGKNIKMEVEEYKKQFIKSITPSKYNNNNKKKKNNNNDTFVDDAGYKQKTITSMLTPINGKKKK